LLKAETRLLGLSSASIRGQRVLLGVVFRGALWLDGVSVSVADEKAENYVVNASTLVRNCKQFSQLHAILLSPQLGFVRRLPMSDLARRVRLPVIGITRTHESLGKVNERSGSFDISIRGKHVTIRTVGVKRKDAESLYKIGCSPYDIVPEAVRIADLLAEALKRTFLK
jgi:endonuclease V-like protein UPF0215 family